MVKVCLSQLFVSIAKKTKRPGLTAATLQKIAKGRAMLEAMVKQDTPIYGVNTGFGEMVYITVDHKHETELQENLIRSHCTGVGEPFTKEEARAIMATRINTFCKGYSGIRPALVEQLLLYLNEDSIPMIPQVGSLGASGALASLAHMAITLLGEGYVFGKDDQRVPTGQVLHAKGMLPFLLKFKEELALINGTSAMTGIGSLVVNAAEEQIRQAEVIAGFALEALSASSGAFQEEGHNLARPTQRAGRLCCKHTLTT